MKWSMDTHKYISEITRAALKILIDNNINLDSKSDEIESAERKLAEANVYKDYESAHGRIRRALFTYFRAYGCLDENGNPTEMGKAFAEEKISVQEISLWYIINYVFEDSEVTYNPIELILTFVAYANEISPSEAYITPYDFQCLVDCDSLTDITRDFVKELISQRKANIPEVNERAIGFDVWVKMLTQSGLFKRNDNRSISLNNQAVGKWILNSLKNDISITHGQICTGIFTTLPVPALSRLKHDCELYQNEGNALAAFLFDSVNKSIINKYIVQNSEVDFDTICENFGISPENEGFYSDFTGFEHLIGFSLLKSDDESHRALGAALVSTEIDKSVIGSEECFDDILKHNLYGIHIKELNDALSEENPHICIGWSCLGNLSDIESRDALAKRYDEHIQKEPRGKGQDVGQVWRFINDVKIGDYIIFADDAVCHIGRVESDYYFDDTENPNENLDYANKRKVTWLKKNIERSSLSTAFHRSLMTAMSIWGLNDYKSSVVELLKGTYIKDIVEDLGEVVENITNEPSQQKALFKAWMTRQKKANGEPYSENTINSYIGQMERGYAEFDKYHDFESVFQIQDTAFLAEYTEYLFNAEGFDEFNDRAGNKACSCGLAKYNEFLSENIEQPEINYNTNCDSTFSRNRILFGAPGTGKSYTLEEERKQLLENGGEYERVTFHPDYSYANFVGTYKPVPDGDAITYKYVPGPFMRLYVKALQNSRTEDAKPHLLIVEEINRANVAAVFGDIFQLLDRDDYDVSNYPIQASEDIKKYLADELGGNSNDYGSLRIPNNMFIWATMNSADQGVFPMDTAFKRRWDFTYLGINTSEDGIRGKMVTLGTGANTRTVEWNALRKEINNKLSSMKINEDKLLGPYFLSQKIVPTETDIDREKFIESFKSKILMYLFDDAAKQKRASLFADNIDTSKYSEICKAFDEKGVLIFCSDISNKFPATQPTDGEEQ